MANCFDQIMCNESSGCEILITDANGLEIDTRYLHDGDAIYLRVPDRPGYTIDGFYFQPNDGETYPIEPYEVGNGLYQTTAICGGTFIVHFKTNMYDLTVIPDDDAHGSTLGGGRYPYNTVVLISAIENAGYHFIGWYIDDVLISNDIQYRYTVTEETVIVARFEGDQYSIIAKPNNRLLGSASGSGVYEYGTEVTLSAIPFGGSRFVSWDDGDTNPTRTITVTENKIYIAIFEREKYTVTVTLINQSTGVTCTSCGVVTGAGEYYYGSVVTLYASPSFGYTFISWDNGGEHVDGYNRYSFIISGDTTVIATFDDVKHTICLCQGFNFSIGWVKVMDSAGQTIADLNSDQNRCVEVEDCAEVVIKYNIINERYRLNDWGVIPLPYEIIDEESIIFTATDDVVICPNIEYIGKVYVNIDFYEECKDAYEGHIQELYSDCTFVFKNEDADKILPITIPPSDEEIEDDGSLAFVETYQEAQVGDTLNFWAKMNCIYREFDHWLIKLVDENGDEESYETQESHLTLVKVADKDIYVTCICTCCCKGTFTINSDGIALKYNDITYSSENSPITVDLIEDEEVTVYPPTVSGVIGTIGGIYDVTNPSTPIDVAHLATSTVAFCYEGYPQVVNGWKTGYIGALTDVRFHNPLTPNILTLFVRVHVDTNYNLPEQLYLDASSITWNSTVNDPDRNSFNAYDDHWLWLPLNDMTYNFNGMYYHVFNGLRDYYFKKITININNIPTLPEFPSLALLETPSDSPYLVKVPTTSPKYSFMQGYDIYMIYHEYDYEPWNDIYYYIAQSDFAEWDGQGQLPTPEATSVRFLTHKGHNPSIYIKRIRGISFTPECNHRYQIHG